MRELKLQSIRSR